MKKIFVLAMGVLAGAMAFGGAQNDLRVTFCSSGPDRYADGRTVLDNEFYALVWVKDGATFAGFAADGSLVAAEGGKVLVSGPWAKDGRCRFVGLQIDAAEASAYAKGAFQLYLLDTRNADGTTLSAKAGVPGAVNGFAAVAETKGDGNGYSSSLSASGSIMVKTVSALPPGAPQPQITDLQVVDSPNGKMLKLKVKNTVPYLRYNVAGGETPQNIDVDHVAVEGANGAATKDGEVELFVPATGSGAFFKVIRN